MGRADGPSPPAFACPCFFVFFRSILEGLKEKYGLLVVYLKLDFSNNKLAIDRTSSSMSVSVNNIQAYISVRTGLLFT